MAMPQRDETIEEIKRLDALLEYAVMHEDEAEAVGRATPRRWSERSAEAGEPTGAREQVCGPGVILTASVNGARDISAGQSPLAKQVARAVRARQNHAGGVPANCGSGEQVGRRPLHRAARLSEQVGRRPFTPAPPFCR